MIENMEKLFDDLDIEVIEITGDLDVLINMSDRDKIDEKIAELLKTREINNILFCEEILSDGHFHGPVNTVYFAEDYLLGDYYLAWTGDSDPSLYEVENNVDSILEMMIDEEMHVRQHPRFVEEGILDLLKRGIIEPGKIDDRFWLIFEAGNFHEFEGVVLDKHLEKIAYRSDKVSESVYYRVVDGEHAGKFIGVYYSRYQGASDYEASFISHADMIDLVNRDDIDMVDGVDIEIPRFDPRPYDHEYSDYTVGEHELGRILYDTVRDITIFVQESEYFGCYAFRGNPDDHDSAKCTEFVDYIESWDETIEKAVDLLE